ncbi:MAG: hypothetical protein DMD82_12990 [Candidatus Rokuibacteriota bacterium]|nr:MAG: hypothetical protein DMD82_12990 [Candidatus Rokubacteria bacterium]
MSGCVKRLSKASGTSCGRRSGSRRRGCRARTVTGNKTLQVGDTAPDFTLKTIGLKEVSLKDFRGKRVVVLFYPLDWTPG